MRFLAGIALSIGLVGVGLAIACGSGESSKSTTSSGQIATPSVMPSTVAEEGPPGNGLAPSGFLAAPGRDRLSICLRRVPAEPLDDRTKEQLTRAIDEAAANLNEWQWAKKFFDARSREVTVCPPPSAMLPTPPRHDSVRRVDVTTVSEHRVFVYFVATPVYEDTFREDPFSRAAAEMLCSGHQCAEVTTALYVPADIRTEGLARGLREALGLYDPCEGRPCS
jgi:hypothetical protein